MPVRAGRPGLPRRGRWNDAVNEWRRVHGWRPGELAALLASLGEPVEAPPAAGAAAADRAAVLVQVLRPGDVG